MKDLFGKQRDIVDKMKPVREKLETAARRLTRYEDYKKRKAKYDTYIKEYNAQKPWKQKALSFARSMMEIRLPLLIAHPAEKNYNIHKSLQNSQDLD
ncbi:MAG: hypothetical protein FWE32_07230 [Oscillospiraceae bacterium]|nr:hypothetical protein [Oscillospiraceae bacterium]